MKKGEKQIKKVSHPYHVTVQNKSNVKKNKISNIKNNSNNKIN